MTAMDTMQAIVKCGSSVAVRSVPVPIVRAADDVVIRVAVAGVCRTDLYVAAGRLPCPDPLILGHEFAGTVHAVGSAVTAVTPGQPVASAVIRSLVEVMATVSAPGGADTIGNWA